MRLEKKTTATLLIAIFILSTLAVAIPMAIAISVSPGTGTLEAAILTAEAGATLVLEPGTYNEGIIVIGKDLTIFGDPLNKPVITPTTDLPGRDASNAWFLVEEGVSFDLSNVVMDGGEFFVYQAIRSHGLTNINNVDFHNIQGSISGTPYDGVAILSFGGIVPGGGGSDSHSGGLAASHLTVTESTFAQIGRIGVVVKGTESTAEIVGCTYTGKGPIDCLDYAFEAGAGGDITVEDCAITNCFGVASTDESTSAGIYVTDYYGIGTSAIITGNTISSTSCAIAVGYDELDASIVVAQYNNLDGNVYGVESTGPQVDAKFNWWGDPIGPGAVAGIERMGNGDAVSDHVDYDPWLSGEFELPTSVPVSLGDIVLTGEARYPIVSIKLTQEGEPIDYPIDFGDVIMGIPTDDLTVTVTNDGEIQVKITTIVIEDTEFQFYAKYFRMALTDGGDSVNPADMLLEDLLGTGYGLPGDGDSTTVWLNLEVPLTAVDPGTYEGVLFFIAEAVCEITPP